MAAGFREGLVEADGFRIRYREAGEGPALVHLHGAGGLRLTPAHELLSRKYRVVAFEMPGFGASAENPRTRDMAELARTMAAAAQALGLDRFNLMGASFGGKAALWLGLQKPERVLALVRSSSHRPCARSNRTASWSARRRRAGRRSRPFATGRRPRPCIRGWSRSARWRRGLNRFAKPASSPTTKSRWPRRSSSGRTLSSAAGKPAASTKSLRARAKVGVSEHRRGEIMLVAARMLLAEAPG